jgi:hypothetical protein
MHGACSALGDAATILGANEVKVIAQNPQKRGVCFYVNAVRLSVDL